MRARLLLFLALAGAACASYETDDGATPPATSDGGAPEGSASEGNAIDAGVRADAADGAAPPIDCVGALVCDDFEAHDVDEAWEIESQGDSARVEKGSDPSFTTAAMHFAMANPTPNTVARLRRELPAPTESKPMTITFRVLVDVSDMDFARVGGLLQTSATGYYPHTLNLFGHEGEDGATITTDNSANPLPFKDGSWHSVKIALTVEKETLQSQLVVDGVVGGTNTSPLKTNDSFQLVVGIFDPSEKVSPRLDLYIDDVVVR